MSLKVLCLGFLLLTILNTSSAQNEIQSIDTFLQNKVDAQELTGSDIQDWKFTDEHTSSISGVHHLYYRQKYNGIEIYGANASAHFLTDGSELKMNNAFVKDLENKISGGTTPGLSAVQAVISASSEMGFPIIGNFMILEEDAANNEYLISKGSASLEDIPAKLMYAPDGDQYVLVWNIAIYELSAENWWEMRVNAHTGQIIDKNNWITSCDWGNSTSNLDFHPDDHSTHSHSIIVEEPAEEDMSMMPMVGSYNVYPLPVESPNHGARVLVANPDDPTASPFGWHDTNGIAGPESTLTIGNNVLASEDQDGNNIPGFSPNGGAPLIFNFPLDLSMHPFTNTPAMVTNLFYWNNVIHDITYQYGFDELGGNFQENNYGNGGLGSDRVNADAQNPGNCNANFGTPPDGFNPRMQMFLCNNSAPPHDGDLDNLVIAHEYAHGISNRLVGGPGNAGCLGNFEQMGEGWSDYYGLWLTMKVGDVGTDSRGVGTYLFGQPANGPGIRPFPYDTDLGDNPHTYNSIMTQIIPHGVGSVWCMMLWEMTWEIINTVPFDPDFYTGTGGNNIAMALVTEGMKLTPCNPGFVDGRDAILAADQALYGGAYQCEIWTAFAKRGLGENATQGSSGSTQDGTEDFTVPAAACAPPQCDPPSFVCPPDMTVQCEADIAVDAMDAMDATATPMGICTIVGQWVDQPHITGARDCDGTTYEYTYRAVDDQGHISSCVQTWTLSNNPPTISVPVGENVECFDDIVVSTGNATVSTSCGEDLDVTIYAPVISGEPDCPGTTYTFIYRVEDQCEREATADRVFTIGAGADPVVTAPDNQTVNCLGAVNAWPGNAEVSTDCGVGSSIEVSGPVISGPMDCPGTTYTYTYEATDACGRTGTDTQVFTVQNDPPVFINAPDVPLQLNCEDEGWEDIIQAWLASIKATTSCGVPVNVNNNYNPNNQGLCINNGTVAVTFFASDQCNRTTTTTGMIIIADTEPPFFPQEAQDELDICNFNTPQEFDDWVDAHGNAIGYDACWGDQLSWSTIPNNPTFPDCSTQFGPVSVTVTFVARDGCGNKASTSATFTALAAGGSLVDDDNETANEAVNYTFGLNQNQPNPFSNETVISFTLPTDKAATLTIYDLSGKVVKLIQGEFAQGYNEIQLSRSELSHAGMLYYELSTANDTAVKKMIIVD